MSGLQRFRILDRHRNLATGRRRIRDSIPGLRTHNSCANRRFWADHIVIGRDSDITRTEYIRHLLASELKRHHRAVTDRTGLRRLKDLRVTQLDGQLVDAPLILALLLAGSLIAAVLRQVALGARRGDTLGDLVTILPLAILELLLHLVIGFLREQNRLFFLGHCSS